MSKEKNSIEEDLLLDSNIITNDRVICVTNKQNCKRDFYVQLACIAKRKPKAIILREKYLTFDEYEKLAILCQKICKEHEVPLIVHSFYETAISIKAAGVHIPFGMLSDENTSRKIKDNMNILGVSIHSRDEAIAATSAGATYLTAGNIYETTCKVGLLGKGIDYLREIVEAVDIPVYGIGGISIENINEVLDTKAAGVCIMSETNKYY